MKRLFASILVLTMLFTLAACGAGQGTEKASEAAKAAEAAVTEAAKAAEAAATEAAKAAEGAVDLESIEMQKISAEELDKQLGNEEYLLIDCRKAEDYAAGHIPGTIGADMDKAKDGDAEDGLKAIKAVAEGANKNIVLVCYSGNRYAKAATLALTTMGYDMSKVFTLEGGMKNWTAVFPDKIEK